MRHKVNKVCRDANKSTLAEAVNKLPISDSGPSAGNEGDGKCSNCYNTIQCVHVGPKYYYVWQTMLERQCCNTVFPQNKCLDAYFKFQLKGWE